MIGSPVSFHDEKGTTMKFFGRTELLSQLRDLWGKKVSSLVTCRGRRRIGKSTLIERFATQSKARFIKLEGLKPQTNTTKEDELDSFATQLAALTGAESSRPADWLHAFIRLSKEIDGRQRTVVLLDEASWMAHGDPLFAATLKIAWDNYLKKHDRLILVVCGSVSVWIKENILESGAFYGRRSLDVVVRELPLCECVKFWGDAAGRTASREIADVLSVTGGVPRYLEEVDPGLSAQENIRRMCFLPNSPLRTDFDEMFKDAITRQPKFSGAVLRSLVDGPRSLTDIANALGVAKGGNITHAIEQLEESGMVASDVGRNPETGAPVRERRYRLRDNYSRFYLKYIEPSKDAIDRGAFVFNGLDQFVGWESLMGLQFENLVINNLRELLKALHMDRVMVTSAAPWARRGSSSAGTKGCQIDLLLQSRMSMCLVEIKRQSHIGREIIDEVRGKCLILPRPPGVSLHTALVFEGTLSASVEADGFFDAVVPFSTLLAAQ